MNHKKIVSLKTIQSDSIDELRQHFIKLISKKLQFHNYDLVIYPEDFDHCCYEYLDGGIYKGKFSLRRARKMFVIEQICKHELNYKIIDQTNMYHKSIIILSEIAEFCFMIKPVNIKNQKYFRLLTMISFGKGVEGSMKKFLNKGDLISEIDLSKLFDKKNEG